MIALDLERLKTIAGFLRSQIGVQQKPVGLVQINDEEAGVIVDALEEYVLRERAMGNARHAEWDTIRGFFRRHGMHPKSLPHCLVCGKEPNTYPPRIAPRELPSILVCDVCRAKALTADIAIRTGPDGHATKVERVNEHGEPLSVLWQFWTRGQKREERLHDPGD